MKKSWNWSWCYHHFLYQPTYQGLLLPPYKSWQHQFSWRPWVLTRGHYMSVTKLKPRTGGGSKNQEGTNKHYFIFLFSFLFQFWRVAQSAYLIWQYKLHQNLLGFLSKSKISEKIPSTFLWVFSACTAVFVTKHE